MSKKQKNSGPEIGFDVMCPCCEASLRVDPVTRAVIAHTPKPVARTFADMEAAARAMRVRTASSLSRRVSMAACTDMLIV